VGENNEKIRRYEIKITESTTIINELNVKIRQLSES
jgi:hypothetical protein